MEKLLTRGGVLMIGGILAIIISLVFLNTDIRIDPYLFILLALIGLILTLAGPIIIYFDEKKNGVLKKVTFGGVLAAFGATIIFAPIIISLLSGLLAFLFGCNDLTDTYGSCNIGGQQMSHLLSTMFYLHWMLFMTILPGFIIIFIGLAIRKATLNRQKNKIA